MRKSAVGILLLTLLSTSDHPSFAQDQGNPHRIVTRTRLQAVFSDLEYQWLKAVQAKNQDALNRMLADDFEVWTPAAPGDPTPREDWIRQAFSRQLTSFHLQQLAVRALTPEVSVANFVLNETFDQAGKPATEEHFIVDVWMNDGQDANWRCTDRYSSVVTAPAPSGTQTDIKPNGKN